MIAELIAKIKADTSDLEKGKVAVRDFEDNLKSAFRRTGDIRVGRALEEFSQNLVSGDIPGAIESITQRITGLGLVWGTVAASLGAGLVFLTKNFHEVEQASKNLQEVNKETPLPGASTEQIQQHTDAIFKALQETGGKWKAFWHDAMDVHIPTIDPGELMFGGEQDEKIEESNRRIEERRKAVANLGTDFKNAAAKQREALESESLQSGVGDKEMERVKARIQATEDYAKIRETKEKELKEIGEANVKDVGEPEKAEARADVAEKAKEAIRLAGEHVALLDREADLASRIAAIQNSALTPELQAAAITKERIGYLEETRALLSANNAEGMKAVDNAVALLKATQAHTDQQNAMKALMPTFEASQLSFQDLLRGLPNKGGSPEFQQAHLRALDAQKELNIAQGYQRKGYQEEAFIHLERAEKIKAGIPLLKESEKQQYALTAAIDSASVFKGMATSLSAIAGAVKNQKNPFLNQ